MEEIMNALIDEIKHDVRYKKFKESEKELAKEETLLQRYRCILDEYQEMKKYETYVDMSETKDKLKQIKAELMQSAIIQDYYDHYHALNDYLDELTQIMFLDISDALSTSQYHIG